MGESLQAMTNGAPRHLADKCGLVLPKDAMKAEIADGLQASEHRSTSATREAGAVKSRAQDAEPVAESAKVFELRGNAPPPVLEDIPSSYGENRVAAMPRDPRCLYLYWEITDEAIADARAKLGPGGPGAWFVLRVYDTTNRHFDGTNANSHHDVPVDRAWKNYFLELNHPRSIFHVEIGMKCHEGDFVALARSSAAEMPSDAVSQDGRSEWMTVQPTEAPPQPEPHPHSCASHLQHRATPHHHHFGRTPAPHQAGSGGGEAMIGNSGWHGETGRPLSYVLGGETVRGEWFQQVASDRFVRCIRWQSAPQQIASSSLPIPVPLESLGPIEIWFEGERRVLKSEDWARVLQGPWHVVIKNIGATGEQRVLDSWLIRMGFPSGADHARVDSPSLYRRMCSAYGHREIFAEGSEVFVREEAGSSQEVFASASEMVKFVGGSPGVFGGANENLFHGGESIVGVSSGEIWHGQEDREQAVAAPRVSTVVTTGT